MAWRQSGEKPLSESMMVSLLLHICKYVLLIIQIRQNINFDEIQSLIMRSIQFLVAIAC